MVTIRRIQINIQVGPMRDEVEHRCVFFVIRFALSRGVESNYRQSAVSLIFLLKRARCRGKRTYTGSCQLLAGTTHNILLYHLIKKTLPSSANRV